MKLSRFMLVRKKKKKERNRARCEPKRDAHTFMSVNTKFHPSYVTTRVFNQSTCVKS